MDKFAQLINARALASYILGFISPSTANGAPTVLLYYNNNDIFYIRINIFPKNTVVTPTQQRNRNLGWARSVPVARLFWEKKTDFIRYFNSLQNQMVGDHYGNEAEDFRSTYTY